jgi:tRNA-splicing ligase RtcB (3'-phosphate/5'-hydroxy nucleic acid ligase)
MERVSAVELSLNNPYGIPVRVFANEAVKVEKTAIQELTDLLELQETVERIAAADPNFFDDPAPGIVRIAVTPDFHKGAGIPIGTVLQTRGFMTPQAIGRDVNCGMRLMTTDWAVDETPANLCSSPVPWVPPVLSCVERGLLPPFKVQAMGQASPCPVVKR